ncbi:hypothetical protein RKD29_006306 [Streptomyces tendae]
MKAVSEDSGVTGNPTREVVRNTALGSYFWCGDTERLICVDLDRTTTCADKAPATDLVVVVSNSAKHGGAGHSGLAADYGWRRRLHALLRQRPLHPDRRPRDGPLPENSIMRSLNTDRFNLPGREAMIAGFHRSANALTPLRNTAVKATRFTRLSVELADPGPETGLSRPQLRWYVDGREARRARGRTSVLPAALGVPSDRRTHRVTATVVDTTTAVRSGAVRDLTSNSATRTVSR